MDKDADSVEKQIDEIKIAARRMAALTAAAKAFPHSGSFLQGIAEVDRGVVELARSFERYLEKG